MLTFGTLPSDLNDAEQGRHCQPDGAKHALPLTFAPCVARSQRGRGNGRWGAWWPQRERRRRPRRNWERRRGRGGRRSGGHQPDQPCGQASRALGYQPVLEHNAELHLDAQEERATPEHPGMQASLNPDSIQTQFTRSISSSRRMTTHFSPTARRVVATRAKQRARRKGRGRERTKERGRSARAPRSRRQKNRRSRSL